MERREVPYARPAGRQANATQEAFTRARSVWPRLDSITGPNRGRTSSSDLARGCPKPTCAGPPGRARACRVLCGLTLASSLFLFFLTAYFLSLTLSLRPFPHPSRFVHFPPSLSLLYSFFSCSSRRFLFFFFFISLHALFFLFFYGFTAFFSFSPLVSLSTVEFLHVSLRELLAHLHSSSQPTSSMFETRLHTRLSFLSLWIAGAPPLLLFHFSLHMIHAVSWLGPGREDEMAPKTNTEGVEVLTVA